MKRFLSIISWISLVFLVVFSFISSRWWLNGFYHFRVVIFIASLILILDFIIEKGSILWESIKDKLPKIVSKEKSYDEMNREELIRAHYRAKKRGDTKLADELYAMIKEEDDYVKCFDMKN